MEKPFDIFWFGDSGPIWIQAAESFQAAKSIIEKLPPKGVGSDGIFDQHAGIRISVGPGCESLHRANL